MKKNIFLTFIVSKRIFLSIDDFFVSSIYSDIIKYLSRDLKSII